MSLSSLPVAEVLLRARVQLVAAECARRQGDDSRAAVHYQAVLARDPGLLRRQGVRLPVTILPDGSPLSERAARLVARSPRVVAANSPLSVTISGGATPRACLLGPAREQLGCASINLPTDVSDDSGARLLIDALHGEAFAIKADLSQADLTTLDGSPAAGRADHRVQSVLDELGEDKGR
jgi:hypothetical protein